MKGNISETVTIFQERCLFCRQSGKFDDHVCNFCTGQLVGWDKHLPPKFVKFEFEEGGKPEEYCRQISENTYEIIADMGPSFLNWFDINQRGFCTQEEIDKVQEYFDERELIVTIHTPVYDIPENATSQKVKFLGIYINESAFQDQVIVKALIEYTGDNHG